MSKRIPARKWFQCRICGTDFERVGPGRDPFYCSSRCRLDSGKARRAKIQHRAGPCTIDSCPNLRRSTTSLWCEAHYHLNYRNGSPTVTKIRVANGTCHHCKVQIRRKLLFCDALCRRRFRMGAPGRHLTCVGCDATLPEDRYLGSMYCSVACKSLGWKAARYGLSIAELREIVANAACCEVCGKAEVELVVDHCHTTGKFRGMLCGPCNVGIGMLAEDGARLLAALDYLRRKGHVTASSALF